MNLYEFEGQQLFTKHGIKVPQTVLVRRGDDIRQAYEDLGAEAVVVKAQVLSGKRGKNQGVQFCSSREQVVKVVEELFNLQIRKQYVAAVLLAEKVAIAEEHYLSITYDTNAKQPVLVYSRQGGMDIEDVPEEKIQKHLLDIRQEKVNLDIPYAQELWQCFLGEDARLVEINPLVKTTSGEWLAIDAKVAIDEDAGFRHEEWNFEARTMLGRPTTDREITVKQIDQGEKYYQGTAGKYIELAGDIAVLFSGGGASIANMDALIKAGLKPANYTEYSGNPPQEKVYELTKVVLSKPKLKGLWIVGGVANFTDVATTFSGIVQALDEIKPDYPIVVRRAGPKETEGMEIMKDCAEKNNLEMKLFGKDTSMSETAVELAKMVSDVIPRADEIGS